MNINKKLLMLFALLSAVVLGCNKQPEMVQGRIVFLVGNVTINGSPAKAKNIVSTGDVITTGLNSKVDIVFQDTNIVRIGADSQVTLDFLNKKASIQKGSFAAVLKGLKENQESGFHIQTPVTAAAVRGTTLYTEVLDQDRTYFCDCNGIIEVEGKNGEARQLLQASHHKALLFQNQAGVVNVTPSTLLNHTDKELEELAQKIGQNIDWNSIPGK